MTKEERLLRLQRMFGRLTEEDRGGLESLSRDPVATLDLPDTEEGEAARRGAVKLSQERLSDIDDREMGGLEAIVMPRFRPVVFIRGNSYDSLEAPWTHLNVESTRKALAATFASVARIELPDTPWTYGGTGFVVGPNLLMTNRHVARIFAQGVGDRRIGFRRGEAAVDFKREVGSPEDDRSAVFEVAGVVMVHPYWDMALLRVEGLGAEHIPLSLSTREPETLLGREVIVVGYPARDERNDLALQDRIFQRQYNVKRLQPGKLREREAVSSFGNDVLAQTHDSSTLGGNSGSAVIDVTTGDVVALHFGGTYLKANYGVPMYELSRDSRVIDTGANFRAPKGPPNEWDEAWRRADGVESTDTASRPAAPASGPSYVATASAPMAPAQSAANVTFTIPLQISISVGMPAGAGVAPTVTAVPIERPMQVPVIHPGLSTRRGYLSDFLGREHVPLPSLTTKGLSAAAKLDDGSFVLKYHHFSIVVNKRRRLAMFTAANVDWRPSSRLVDGRKPTRRELTGLPEEAAEQWVTDPRIPDAHQLPDDFYTRDRGAFDKGHLVRREDASWGSSFGDMQKANGDTYHTTNCSPQVAGFNQSARGKDNWGDLENMVQKETRAEKAVVFSGPVLAGNDPTFEGHDLRGEVSIQIPRAFWKVVVAETDGKVRAYGFVLKQSLRDVSITEEFVLPPEWERHMLKIADIEEKLDGHVKLDWLKEHDAFDSDEARRMQEENARLGVIS
jgi:endonuclease G